jgi:hypothetical protein
LYIDSYGEDKEDISNRYDKQLKDEYFSFYIRHLYVFYPSFIPVLQEDNNNKHILSNSIERPMKIKKGTGCNHQKEIKLFRVNQQF